MFIEHIALALFLAVLSLAGRAKGSAFFGFLPEERTLSRTICSAAMGIAFVLAFTMHIYWFPLFFALFYLSITLEPGTGFAIVSRNYDLFKAEITQPRKWYNKLMLGVGDHVAGYLLAKLPSHKWVAALSWNLWRHGLTSYLIVIAVAFATGKLGLLITCLPVWGVGAVYLLGRIIGERIKKDAVMLAEYALYPVVGYIVWTAV